MGQAKLRKAKGEYPDASKPKPAASPVSWEVIGDLATHPKSTAVLGLLERLRDSNESIGGKSMVVTLERSVRSPIIKAKVVGLGAFMGLIEGMQALDLQDRLEKAVDAEGDVDAAFS